MADANWPRQLAAISFIDLSSLIGPMGCGQ